MTTNGTLFAMQSADVAKQIVAQVNREFAAQMEERTSQLLAEYERQVQEAAAQAAQGKRRRGRRGSRPTDNWRGQYAAAYPEKSYERDGRWRVLIMPSKGEPIGGKQLGPLMSKEDAIRVAKDVDWYVRSHLIWAAD